MIPLKLRRGIRDDLKALDSLIADSLLGAPTVRSCRKLLASEYLRYPDHYKHPRKFDACRRPMPGEARVLSNLYDRDLKCLGYVKKLREVAREILPACPYCGLPTEDITLDHYLPRAEKLFPHFSVLSMNLVPACMGCQRAKGTFYPGSKGRKAKGTAPHRHRGLPAVAGKIARQRMLKQRNGPPKRDTSTRRQAKEPLRVLHPYYDHIFDTRSLRVVESGNGVYLLAASMGNRRKVRLIQFHLHRLKLRSRTAREVTRNLDHFVSSLTARKITTLAGARVEAQALLRTTHGEMRHGGTIESLVRHCVAGDDVLLDKLLNKSLHFRPRLVPASHVIELDLG